MCSALCVAQVGEALSTGVLAHNSAGYLQYDAARKLLFVSGVQAAVSNLSTRLNIPDRHDFHRPWSQTQCLQGLGLCVFDVADPASPKKVCKNVSTGVYTHDGGGFNLLTPSGKHLVTAGGQGMAVFDVMG
jgi:hypothetical protein